MTSRRCSTMKLLIVLGVTLVGLATISQTLIILAHSQPVGATSVVASSSSSASPSSESINSDETEERDPLVALASNHQNSEQLQHYVQQKRPQPARREVVHYVYHQTQPEELSHVQPQPVAPTSGEQAPPNEQNVVYRVEPTYHYAPPEVVSHREQTRVQVELAEQQPAVANGELARTITYAHQVEPQEIVGQPQSVAGPSGAEYPGEVVYVGSNGEQISGQDSSRNLRDSVSSIADAASMPATILTEVPVKDMPYDVLEKLKREYGVKVVATRERPGANLVINCDGYSSQESSSICKRSAQQAPSRYVYLPSIGQALPATSGDQQPAVHYLQPQPEEVADEPEFRREIVYATSRGEPQAPAYAPQTDPSGYQPRPEAEAAQNGPERGRRGDQTTVVFENDSEGHQYSPRQEEGNSGEAPSHDQKGSEEHQNSAERQVHSAAAQSESQPPSASYGVGLEVQPKDSAEGFEP